MLQIASKPIEPPDDEHVESTSTSVGNQRVERRPAVLRARDAVVDVLTRRECEQIDTMLTLRLATAAPDVYGYNIVSDGDLASAARRLSEQLEMREAMRNARTRCPINGAQL